MLLSDISIKRPIFAAVMSWLLIIFGIISFMRLSVREYPNINPPIVSIDTTYTGASAHVMENRVTKLIENSIAGIEGLRFINSSSSDGRSRINLEFTVNTDIDVAANDIRDKVASIARNLPEAADAPRVQKVDADAQVILWLNLASDTLTPLELTDYAKRYLVDQFSVLDGIAQIRIGGGLEYAMRIWIDPDKLAAKGLTIDDIGRSLQQQNVELPAGFIESIDRQFTVRVEQHIKNAQDFRDLVINPSDSSHLVRLGDVAEIELSASQQRILFRGNQQPMIGFGIIRQSTANTLEVAQQARNKALELNKSLPKGISFKTSFDSSAFIQSAIDEVYSTLLIASVLVILIILIFLKSWRATLVPAVTVPVSLIAAFILLYYFNFSINILTLLALLLSVGLVVDDAIVVLENIHKHIEKGETPLVAAYLGTKEVGFAVIATTLVLLAVFLPITFLQGTTGRLFSEFAITLSSAVIFSSFVALSLSPVIASKVLKEKPLKNSESHADKNKANHQNKFGDIIEKLIKTPLLSLLIIAVAGFSCLGIYQLIPSEYSPKEDRGAFYLSIKAPEGSSFKYTSEQVLEIEKRLLPLIESGEVKRLLLRAPRSFGSPEYSDAFGVIVLEDWNSGRRNAWAIMADVKKRLADLPSVKVSTIMRSGLGGGVKKPVEISLGGPDYDTLTQWRDTLMDAVSSNPNIIDFDHDFDETKPQLLVKIDHEKAADLGVSVLTISNTLETLLGSKEVTQYRHQGEEYPVLLQAKNGFARTIEDANSIHISSDKGTLIPLSQVTYFEEFADAKQLNRYNRLRAISFDAELADGYSLGEALAFIEKTISEELPPEAQLSYKGQSLEYKDAGQSSLWVFALSILIVALVLAAQFESLSLPLVIILNTPFAIAGALFSLWISGHSLNIYTQIAMIMLIGLSAKNGILIVEFTNQLRDQGVAFKDAIIQASMRRLRPIAMTVLTTAMGSLPLVLSSGAGSETRQAIGVAILGGVVIGSFFTLFITPMLYALLAKGSQSPQFIAKQLEASLNSLKNK